MRVISGKFRGQQLVGFKNSNIRPTTDRVKETIFNKFMGDIVEARVLDLFAGTGNLSIEALSRGAASVDSVEAHRSSIKIIEQNLKKIKIDSGIRVIQKEVIKFLTEFTGEPYDLILIDPPFTKKMAHEVMMAMSVSKAFAAHTLFMIEASRQERMDSKYNSLVQYDKREFGDKSAFFFEVEGEI